MHSASAAKLAVPRIRGTRFEVRARPGVRALPWRQRRDVNAGARRIPAAASTGDCIRQGRGGFPARLSAPGREKRNPGKMSGRDGTFRAGRRRQVQPESPVNHSGLARTSIWNSRRRQAMLSTEPKPGTEAPEPQHAEIKSRKDEIAEICRRYGARCLDRVAMLPTDIERGVGCVVVAPCVADLKKRARRAQRPDPGGRAARGERGNLAVGWARGLNRDVSRRSLPVPALKALSPLSCPCGRLAVLGRASV